MKTENLKTKKIAKTSGKVPVKLTEQYDCARAVNGSVPAYLSSYFTPVADHLVPTN